MSDTTLVRYGVTWGGGLGLSDPLLTQANDGYWTPWHIAQAELNRLRADNAQLAKECSALSQAADIAAATLEDFIYYGDDRWPSDETVEAVLATIKIAQENRGTRDMLDDAVALRAELDRVTAKRDAAVALAREYRCAIEEVRASLHAMGRRPEHCHEMSVLDDALALDAPPA